MGQLTQTTVEVQDAIDQQYDGDEAVNVGWDDLRAPATRIRQGVTAKPDFDTVNFGLLFPQNDPLEIAYIILQFPHGYKEGSNIRPHIHYTQNGASDPVFEMDYRWYNVGDDASGSFTTITQNGTAGTVADGFAQIGVFPEIDGTGMELSSIFELRLYRDDNVVTGDVLLKEFDIHYQTDQERGSRQEYVK